MGQILAGPDKTKCGKPMSEFCDTITMCCINELHGEYRKTIPTKLVKKFGGKPPCPQTIGPDKKKCGNPMSEFRGVNLECQGTFSNPHFRKVLQVSELTFQQRQGDYTCPQCSATMA